MPGNVHGETADVWLGEGRGDCECICLDPIRDEYSV